MSNWSNEMRPYTEKFLDLLLQKKFEILYKQYAMNSGMSYDDFLANMKLIDSELGKIKSYKYSGMSISAKGQLDDLTGYFIYYKLITNNDKVFNVTFQAYPVIENESSSRGEIYYFDINQNFGKNAHSIRLHK